MGALVAFLLAAEMVHGERIDELVGNAHAGVQRGRRILEDDRDDTADFHALLRGAMRDVLPFEQHLPDVSDCSPHITFAVVDLPQPDSPTMPIVLPGMSLRFTPLTAVILLRWNRPEPARVVNTTFASFSSMIGTFLFSWGFVRSMRSLIVRLPFRPAGFRQR